MAKRGVSKESKGSIAALLALFFSLGAALYVPFAGSKSDGAKLFDVPSGTGLLASLSWWL